uniref:Uncharacterized protein n=1 Tax=Klebsiella pneumoniae TaxID=573 RepID=A0A8B0SV66_KLEPN|nr:hypothetical protein [Klebsiella pneumoniae]
MLKKTVITSAVVSALLLSSSGIAAAVAGDKSGAQTPAASRLVMSSDSYGEIIGQFNSPDGAVVGGHFARQKCFIQHSGEETSRTVSAFLPSCMPPLRQKAGSLPRRQNRGLISQV